MKKRITKGLAVLTAVMMIVVLSAGCGRTGGNTGSGNAKDNAYRVMVVDEKNQPVSDVTVQFCNDTECKLGTTAKNGVAVFESDTQGQFAVHMLEVPEGYEEDDTEYVTEETYSLLKVVLKGGPVTEDSGTKTLSTGVEFEIPEAFKNTDKALAWNEMSGDQGVYYSVPYFYGVTQAVYDDFMDAKSRVDYNDENSVAEYEKKKDGVKDCICGPLFVVVATRNGETMEEAESVPIGNYTVADVVRDGVDLGKKGDYQYYLYSLDYSLLSGVLGENQSPADVVDEYKSLVDGFDAEEFAKTVTLAAVPVEKLTKGSLLTFEAVDFDGNAVSSAELFAGHDVTMVNCWGTWCYYCIEEFPELVKLNAKMQKKGNRIVGVCQDGDVRLERAMEEVEQAGITYPNVYIEDGFNTVFMVDGYPTTYFVDSEGRLLTDPISGADVKGYKKAYKEALAAVK